MIVLVYLSQIFWLMSLVGLPALPVSKDTGCHILCFSKQWLNPLCFCRISSAIIKSHPLRSDVFKSDLDKNLPNIQDIQAALVKLRQICVIGNQYPVGERDDCSTHSIE